MLFEDFHLHSNVLEGLKDLSFDEPTEIQSECIPLILNGKDVIASSQTGTGKTGAFVIPMLSKLSENPQKGIKALILTPTRELAKQVDEQIVALGYHTGVTSVTVYGGGTPDDWNRQEKALYHEKVNIVVATPGRLIDHMKIKPIDFSSLDYFVLDEADRMLDMGFLPDVSKIESKLPRKRQNLLFSATIPNDIEKFIRTFSKSQERVNIATFKVAKGVRQVAYKVPGWAKEELLLHLLSKEEYTSCIVFVGTKKGTEELTRSVKKKGINAQSIHGDRTQSEREEALRDFRSGKCKVLIATDVLSRGIDIDDISHIINFDVPGDLDDYIHRIGRTARAESTGDAITFVSERDRNRIRPIYHAMKDDLIILEIPDEIRSSGKKDEKRPDNRRQRSSQTGRRSSSGKNNRSNKRQSGTKTASENKDTPGKKGKSENTSSNRRRKPQSKSNSSHSSQKSESKSTKSTENKRSNSQGKGRKTTSNSKRNYKGKKTNTSSSNESGSQNRSNEKAGNSNSKPRRNNNRRRSNNNRKNSDSNQGQEESLQSMRARQRKSLRDAQDTKRALMSNQVEPNPNQDKKGLFGRIKKIFSK